MFTDSIDVRVDLENYMKQCSDMDKKTLSLYMQGYDEREILTITNFSRPYLSRFKRRLHHFLNK